MDANHSHKTLGTVRLYASVVSNFGALADPGEDGACDAFPFFWSDWIPALFDRFFAFFRNVDPATRARATGADKHRGYEPATMARATSWERPRCTRR